MKTSVTVRVYNTRAAANWLVRYDVKYYNVPLDAESLQTLLENGTIGTTFTHATVEDTGESSTQRLANQYSLDHPSSC
jgi:hypothetical protein